MQARLSAVQSVHSVRRGLRRAGLSELVVSLHLLGLGRCLREDLRQADSGLRRSHGHLPASSFRLQSHAISERVTGNQVVVGIACGLILQY